MSINELTWDPKKNIAQWYVVSFFVDIYKDSALAIIKDPNHKNESLIYFNRTGYNNISEAQICAAMCIAYLKNQGLEYHFGSDENKLYDDLVSHLKNGKGKVIDTVEIIDRYFLFSGE